MKRVAAALEAKRTIELPEAARARAAAYVITATEGAALHLDRLRKQLLAVPALVLVSARRATLALNAAVAAGWARFLRTLAVLKTA